jgi:hypothetical protein
MQMHIDKRELTETIDALDFALLVLNVQIEQGQIGGMIASRTVEVLQGLRLAYMFAAAKEQRKNRANVEPAIVDATRSLVDKFLADK